MDESRVENVSGWMHVFQDKLKKKSSKNKTSLFDTLMNAINS